VTLWKRLIAPELMRLGWQESDLAGRRKSDLEKLTIAARLRRGTTPPIKAIASRMHPGTSKSANARLDTAMREGVPSNQGELGICVKTTHTMV
jgi:hypothetical protein